MVHEEVLPLSTLRCCHCLQMESSCFASAAERWIDVMEEKECGQESFCLFHHGRYGIYHTLQSSLFLLFQLYSYVKYLVVIEVL